MNNRKPSIDGFIPRRSDSQLGDRHLINAANAGAKKAPQKPLQRAVRRTPSQARHQDFRRKELRSTDDLQTTPIGVAREGRVIGRPDIDESLNSIDEQNDDGRLHSRKLSRKDRRRLKKESRTRKQKIRRRIGFGVMWLAIAIIIAVIGFFVYKAVVAGDKVFQGNIFDIVQNEPLKEDANGRSNFLVFGTAEDDEGGEHGGANLTDSIMVLSIDQDKKDAYMLSLPRDLWVEYAMPDGGACTVGYQGKLNAQYFCASDDGTNEESGASALSEKVGDITGLDIQYYIHLNFTAVVDAVDAVGGVDVTINSEDPRGILDRNFDWKCGYRCYFVNYKNGETVHLDGEHALALARARNAAGGYGLPNGNFDREKNQQLIIKALREKAVSAGTLTNLGAVTGLIDALGNNLRTNVQTKEIRTLMDLGTQIKTESIISLSLNDEDEMLVTTGNHNGQSIVRPYAGLMDYSEIIAYVQREISSDPFVKEEPSVSVYNGTEETGIAQLGADALEAKGFIIGDIDNAPEGTYAKIEIYQVNAEKTASAAKLAELYGVKLKTTTPPVSVTGATDFVIIIGDSSVVR
ncbi:MAG: LCP family protein [Candidatus Microsaccharimonas sp.]